jgi:hypothetical protein
MAQPEAPPSTSKPIPYRQIRAQYDDDTITVYQAYSATIADAAVKAQRLNASPDFKPARMTWIKPSWCWMMYRSGYSHKDARQARVLALKMKHEHFLGLMRRAEVVNLHRGPGEAGPAGDGGSVAKREGGGGGGAAVVVQWDPERSPRIGKLEYRSIQIGIPAQLSTVWSEEWIVEIQDVTETARKLKATLDENKDVKLERLVAEGLIPVERPYEVPEDVERILCMRTNSD